MNIMQAERMNDAPLSGIWNVLSKVYALKEEGKDVVDLTVGQPDFFTPDYIKKAGKNAIDNNFTVYPPITGIPKLKEAISAKCLKARGRDYDADEILVTNGVTHGMFLAMGAYLNPEDEIIIPNPGYDVYTIIPNYFTAVIKSYDLLEENNYQIDQEQLEKLITEKTKMIVLISPNNPTGSVLNQESIQSVADLVKGKNIIVLTDEIYERISYDDTVVGSIAQVVGMKEQCILINGFSKYYSMTGWRIGYMAATKKLLEPLIRLSFLSAISCNSIAMHAALQAINEEDDTCQKMCEEFNKRRKYLYEELNDMPYVSCLKPKGAFYIFLNIRETGMTSKEFSDYLLQQYLVATVPGTEFGSNGEGFVRLSYAADFESIQRAVTRIGNALIDLKDRKGI